MPPEIHTSLADLRDVTTIIDSGAWFSCAIITADTTKHSGGEIVRFAKCRILRKSTEDAVIASLPAERSQAGRHDEAIPDSLSLRGARHEQRSNPLNEPSEAINELPQSLKKLAALEAITGAPRPPSHGYHFTRNVELFGNHRIRKIHPLLVFEINFRRVI